MPEEASFIGDTLTIFTPALGLCASWGRVLLTRAYFELWRSLANMLYFLAFLENFYAVNVRFMLQNEITNPW